MVNAKILSMPLVVQAVDKMHDKEGFSICKLRRKFSPFLKTAQLGDDTFILTLNEGGTVRCVFSKNEQTVTVTCCTRFRSNANFRMHVVSNKHFMQKLLKHELFNPMPTNMTAFEKDLFNGMLTATLNVRHYDTLPILFNLHFRFESQKLQRADCSFQVLNAYDMWYNYRHSYKQEYLDWIATRIDKIDKHLASLC